MQQTLAYLVAGVTMCVSAISAAENENNRLVTTIDCTKEYGPEAYFAFGSAVVKQSAIGSYREAEAKPGARFGYRFAIENVGKPHVAIIRFPDDRRRTMMVSDGSTYDLGAAVFTRPDQPVTGRMQEVRQLFWPRWKDCSIVFGNPDEAFGFGNVTSGAGPAAAASVAIYEVDEPPPLAVPGDSGDGTRREFGVQFEDPCGSCASEGAATFDEWLDRTIAYARHSGQKTLVYPIKWYHGPLFPSTRETANYFDFAVPGKDRKQYVRWTTHPDDWVASLLERFGREGLEFKGVMVMLRLGSLLEKMNTDLDSIKAGKDTICNMLANDRVQGTTNDWTVEYNVQTFPQRIEFFEKNRPFGEGAWGYGERLDPHVTRGPIFNPLHPAVQEAILGMVQETVERYGRYPAFKGVSFYFWPTTMFWFGSLDSGYDDYTVGLFQKETGVEVPVDAKAPDRFSKRYAFLTGAVKAQWIAWRCEKVRDLLCRIRDVVVRARSDLRMTLTLPRSDFVNYYRPGGLDIALLRDEPNLDLDLDIEVARPISFDSPDAQCGFRGVRIFNTWIENWGEYKWFQCDPNDSQAKGLATIMGKPAEGICRMNSEYPKDGFWWDSQLRITPAFPAGEHFLEHYAHAVAEYDACSITRGGLVLDTAHTEAIQAFAKAYRALPAHRFETVGDSTDPVTARTLLADGRRYLYLVNRDHYPVTVSLQLEAATGKATDLATNQAVDAPAEWSIILEPYQLRSFALAPEVKISGFKAHPPKEVIDELATEARQVLQRIEKAQADGKPTPPETAFYVSCIQDAVKTGHLASLRSVLKCEFILKNFP